MTNAQKIDFIIYVSYGILVPLVIGLITYRKMLVRERVFFFVILGYFLNTVLQDLTNSSNNLYTMYTGTVLELLPAAIALYLPFLNKKNKPRFTLVIIMVLISIMAEGILVSNGFSMFNSFSRTLESILIIWLGAYSMIKLRRDEMVINLFEEPFFWFSIGITIYHAGSIAIFALKKMMMEISNNLLLDMVFTQMAIYALFILLMCIGLIQIGKRSHTFKPT